MPDTYQFGPKGAALMEAVSVHDDYFGLIVDALDEAVAAERERLNAKFEEMYRNPPGGDVSAWWIEGWQTALDIAQQEVTAPAAEGHQLHRVPQEQDTEETP